MKKKIIALEDNSSVAQIICELLQQDPTLEVNPVQTELQFYDALLTQKFDAALIDLSIDAKKSGLKMLQEMQESRVTLPAVVCSAHDVDDYALRCLELGAKGYVCKDSMGEELLASVRAAMKGDYYVSGERGQKIITDFKRKSHE